MRKAIFAAAAFALALAAYSPNANAAQQKGAHYNCQNGPQLTVIFTKNNGQITARYVYDGPQSAMKIMWQNNADFTYFSNQNDSLKFSNRGKSVTYSEAAAFTDRCTVFKTF